LAGDPKALRALVETYQGSVFGLCLRIARHRHDAEDITQDVLLRAIRGLSTWDRLRPLRPWILAIAANRCRTYLARLARRPFMVDSLAEYPEERNPGSDPDLAAELELAMSELRPEYRLVIVMYHEQSLGYDEISEAMSRPVGTIKTWLHRARAEMARFLAKRPGLSGLVPEVYHEL
jgi:RNA polymerase sigma-70 factor (ECF subfamily)